jgi:hypothetical protein
MRSDTANPVSKVLGLLKRRNVAFAMLGGMLTFAGAFAIFTYLRPFLETYPGVSVPQLSLLLLGLGLAGFAGTYVASALIGRHLYTLMRWLPMALGAVTLAMLAAEHVFWAVGLLMIALGALNSAIPVYWSTWLSKGIADEPGSGGGLMVANPACDHAWRRVGRNSSRPYVNCRNADRRHHASGRCVFEPQKWSADQVASVNVPSNSKNSVVTGQRGSNDTSVSLNSAMSSGLALPRLLMR